MGMLDEEHHFILIAILQINGIIKQPKREKSKKGSFDYNYAKAEKGDKEYQLLVAKAYREGDGVPKNIRPANLWEGVANNKIVEQDVFIIEPLYWKMEKSQDANQAINNMGFIRFCTEKEVFLLFLCNFL